MGGKFLKLRTIVIAAVIAVFACSIWPLTPRDFYKTFLGSLKERDNPVATELVAEAKRLQAARPDLNQAAALLQAAEAKQVDLVPLVKGGDLAGNADAIALVRKKASGSIRLGLDLNGGVEFILELIPDKDLLSKIEAEGTAADRSKMEKQIASEFNRYREQAIETLRKRLESQNIFESDITPFGARSVSLKAPITSRDEKDKLLSLIAMSCKLDFRLVHPDSARLLAGGDPASFRPPPGYEVLEEGGRSHARYLVARRPEMTGQSVARAMPVRDQFGQIKIALEFNSKGAADFARVTGENLHRQLAIVLDGKLYCAPVIQSVITGGHAEISGSFSNEEAQQIADALSAGSFPFRIDVTAVYDTAPSLGADNVRNGIYAGLLASVLLTIFMCFYYYRSGAIACIALGVNVVLLLGAMAAFGATLTMPGIAGVILTVGMAVDANVLIFERIREELSAGKNLATAIELGYDKAFSAVFDGNITTLICSLILMYLGNGPVKGFAVSLSIGIVASMFTAICLTRLIYDYALRFGDWKTLKMRRVFSKPNYDFLGKWKIAALFSVLLILVSLLCFVLRGQSAFGVDFTGGTRISCSYVEQVPVSELEKELQSIDPNVRIGYKSNPSARDNRKLEILIRDRNAGAGAFALGDRVLSRLNEKFPALKAMDGQETTVGGLVGAETAKASVIAILLSLLGMSIYISIRFEFSFAAAGMLALVHDAIIAVGIFLLMGREISLSVVAAVLTVIGYSINDTIVIFDRIREEAKLTPEKPIRELINYAINRTLSRTLLTSFTTLLVVVVMFCFGGIAINDFILVIMLGIIIGTYSTIFIASPLALLWHRRIGTSKL